ncbi:hypothetical protein ABT075_38300 [Streptomyces sp. NPDC002677]|uniref:hypothetical protein n=1 Tax=Streptomyces sp. NPDC002677 TaxID=3154774 RepID=UPI003329DCEC
MRAHRDRYDRGTVVTVRAAGPSWQDARPDGTRDARTVGRALSAPSGRRPADA